MSFTPGSTHGQMASINMTPLIDVMLVLLIIFMVAAPMLTTGVDVNLPESRTGKNLQSEALVVTLERDGRIQFEQALRPGGRAQGPPAPARPPRTASARCWCGPTRTSPTAGSSPWWTPSARPGSPRWASSPRRCRARPVSLRRP